MSESKKPVLLACQTCGTEPVTFNPDHQPDDKPGENPDCLCCCRFCSYPVMQHSGDGGVPDDTADTGEDVWTFPLWNARQFRARHEAIDRIVLAMAEYYERILDETTGREGPGTPVLKDAEEHQMALQMESIRIHESNLARRKAEAEKLMGGKA